MYKFKPLNNYYLCYVVTFYCFITHLNIFGLYDSIDKENKYIYYSYLFINILPLLIYLLERIFCKYKYVIDERYIIKYKAKKILFKINKEDVKKIMINKTNIFKQLIFVLDSTASKYNAKLLTNISFLFEKCDVLSTSKYQIIDTISLKDRNNEHYQEYNEILTYRQAKKISKILNIKMIKYK